MPSPTNGEAPRQTLARAAVVLVASVAGVPRGVVRATVCCDGVSVVVEVSLDEARLILGPPVRPPLTELEGELLAALGETESKPAAVARRAGKNCHSGIYEALHALVNKGYAKKGIRGGYQLAG